MFGVYSFLGKLTSNAIIHTIIERNLNYYIDSIQTYELYKNHPNQFDLLLIHQRDENFINSYENFNYVCFDGTNFIDSNVIFHIKSTYLKTSNYEQYLSCLSKSYFTYFQYP